MAAKKPLILDVQGQLQQMQAGDFLDVDKGGTGGTTQASARQGLGLTIGTQVQAWGANLDALDAMVGAGYVVKVGAGSYAARSLVGPAAGIVVANGDGGAGNPTLSLANDLGALEALSGNGFAVRTAADTWAQRSITSAARLVVTNGDGVAANPSIDLATVANAGGGSLLKFATDSYGRVTGTSAVATGDLTALLNSTYLGLLGGTMQGHITLFADGVNAMHPVTKQQLDSVSAGLVPKPSMKALMTTNVNVANPGTAVFDGVTFTAGNGERLFLAGQTAQAENGPWIFNGSGAALTRPADFDSNAEIVSGASFFIDQGSSNSDSVWTLVSSGPYVLGTTALVFTQTNSLGQINAGNGLTKSGNTLSAAITARLSFNAGSLDLAAGIVTAGTYTKLNVDTYGRVTGGATATPADIGAQPASSELSGLAGLAAIGIIARTATGAYSARTLTAPAAGITFSNAAGTAGNPTLALANDLAALEGLSATGFAVRTGSDAWTQRAITGTARVTVTNGDGVAGAPTIDLPSGIVAPGTYQSLTVDTYGRVIAGTVSIANGYFNGSVLQNNEVATLPICNAVYSDGNGTVRKATANAAGTSDVTGLAYADINAATNGVIATSGEMTATTAQWDAVTGQTGGLTPGARYFLDNTTAGRITTTPPSSGYICPVGKAISTTKMLVRIGDRIQL